ncbi:serine peptidase precursor [Haloferula helveola]|uniref:Serine peptidase n=1 Tax=Haloferula helveola TaxID=490095 RepID=A0ABN6H315_9BACT|nr:serine peptidase precursor [Haloferula helveola]
MTVTVNITDDSSGFDFGNFFLYRPGDQFVDSFFFDSGARISGDDLDGVYEMTLPVSQYSPPGTWSVGVLAFDNDSNQITYDSSGTAFPVPGDEEFDVTNAGTIDNAIPTVANLSASPATIDTSGPFRTVTLTLDIADPLSGFLYGFVNVYDPNSNFQNSINPFYDGSNRTSGTDTNGSYQITFELPPGSLEGTWMIDVSTRDQAGNSGFSPGSSVTFEVDNSGAATGDVSDAIDATQFPWSVSGDEDWFFQTSVTHDGIDAAQSGPIDDNGSTSLELTIIGPGTLDFWWKVDSEEDYDILSVEVLGTGNFEEISGNVDWTQSSVLIPPGPQTVIFDYSKDNSVSSGADTGWVDRVYFAADADGEAPVIQYISITPNPVDISGGDQTYTITVEVSDEFNGFDSGNLTIYDPFGEYYDDLYFDSFNLVSGDEFFGTYEVEGTIYQSDLIPQIDYSLGQWYVEAEVGDAVDGYSRYYSEFDDPFPNPGDETFVVSDGGSVGTGPPVLESINSILPDPVDASAGATSVTVNFDVSDGDNGLDYGFVELYNPTGGFVNSVYFSNTDLVAGDEFSGTYEVTVPIPQYAPPGTWSVNFYLQDFGGDDRNYPFDEPFANPGDEEFAVTNTGTADTTGPVLHSFSLNPTTVDTTSMAETIDVDFNVTDDLAGIRGIFLFVYDPSGTFQFTVSVDPASGVAGDFTTTINLPMSSAEGTWEVVVFLRDFVGNTNRYGQFGDPFPVPGSEEFVNVTPTLSTFETLMAAYPLTGADAAADANPDFDLFSNIFEILLGLDPTVADFPVPAVYDSHVAGGELRIDFTIDPSLSIHANGQFLEVDDGTNPPFEITGQSSNNLSTWTHQLPVLISGTTYRVSIPIGPDTTGNLRLFARDP